MAGDGIDRFGHAAEPFGGAGVDQQQLAALQSSPEFVGLDQRQQRWPVGQRALRRVGRDVAGQGQAGSLPGADVTVDDGYGIVTQPTGEAPDAAGHLTALRVVGDDLGVVGDAQPTEGRDDLRPIGHRVPAVPAGLRPGQVAFDVEEPR